MNSFFARWKLALYAPLLLTLGACAHPGPSGGIGGGGNTIIPPPPPPTFSFDDLMGDWIGQLAPDSSGRLTQNFYLRFDSDLLTECADSAGNEWTLTNSDRFFDLRTNGRLDAEMGMWIGSSSLSLQAQMDEAHTVLTGTYLQVGGDLFPVSGTLILTRSGAGTFTIDMLEGKWAGSATRVNGRGQTLELDLDATGEVLGGAIRRRGGSIRRSFAAGAGSFSFFDASIGRIEDVELTATDGRVSRFHYLLLDVDGTLLAGPGTDEVLGAGLIRLSPALPVN